MIAPRHSLTRARRQALEAIVAMLLLAWGGAALAVLVSRPALGRNTFALPAVAIAALAIGAAVARRGRLVDTLSAARSGLRATTPKVRAARGSRQDGTPDDVTPSPAPGAPRLALGPPDEQPRSAAVPRPPGSRLSPGSPVIGYLTMSEDEGDGPDHGEDAIVRACAQAGWRLAEIVRDRETSGRSLDRPGIAYALRRIASGEAHALVVGDITRVCRSIVDLGALLRWFADADAPLVAADLGVDTSTADGQRVADVLMRLAASERDRIADRTRLGLAGLKAEGRSVGPPAVGDRPELRKRILAMRQANMTLQAIADTLNAEGVPTARGGARWRPSSVQRTLGYRRPGERQVKESPATSANDGSEG
jgi:DNA invertase Pin-like site-specific DNA recombinase